MQVPVPSEPEDSVEALLSHEGRCNTSSAALGRLTRKRCCGRTFIWSPDACIQLLPTGITAVLVFGVVFTLWSELGVIELLALASFLFSAAASAFTLCSSDPGVYPRLRLGEIDPLRERMDLVYCRVCALRRPPRVSHCYECDVCVLEHDHHCGVLGGCVGQRTMRWFMLYLISIEGALFIGVFWLFRALIHLGPEIAGRGVRLGENASKVEETDVAPHAPATSMESEDMRAVVIVLLFIAVSLISMLVGGMMFYYFYLVVTCTTRRESQRKSKRTQQSLTFETIKMNVARVIYPPPSLLVESPTLNVEDIV
uniref:Palmitoyltransferase n=1 Tax=Trypanosoma congolense (strain IL3000) TaxID=1068625 RepID=G0V126_TRYCI|nr:unnamed protein product [Trypanosoma congolense IL3000]